MASPREDAVKQAAGYLIDELELTTYPIDPFWIAAKKELPVEFREGFPAGVYGAMWRSGNQFGIVVSSACPTDGHRRFTVAHELGHYHVDGHVERLFARGDRQVLSEGHFRGRKDPIEVEADAFAAELLMPERFARPAVRRLGSDLAAVRALSDGFGVSLSCAAVRLAALTDEPLAIVLSYRGVVEWTARSPALWAQGGWARRTMRQEWVPPRSGTRRLTNDATGRMAGAAEASELFACEWFDTAPPDVAVREEALGLGSYGRVLTVLAFPGLPDADEAYVREQRANDEAQRGGDLPASRRSGAWKAQLRGYSLDELG